MTLTEQQVREILAGCEKATPGPWTACHDGDCQCGYVFGDSGVAYIFKALSLSDDVDPVAVEEARRANTKHVMRLDPQTVSALCEELLSRRAADAAVRDAVLDIAAKIAEAVEMQQDIDHGSANSGGAEQAAEAIRALKSKASP